jgi:hypothetical protein
MEPSAVASDFREKIKQVIVDEYGDDALFSLKKIRAYAASLNSSVPS